MRAALRFGAALIAVTAIVPGIARAEGEESTTNSPTYVFPFSRVPVRYARDHLDYPATDVFGCYAKVLAPTAGTIGQVRRKDKWIESIDAPGTRGGLTITLIGDDTVRYYFSHLGRVKVRLGQRVSAGQWIGVMGSSGNARRTLCHTHVGISRICPNAEEILLQGEIWPWKYLDAWREGRQLSPRKEKNALVRKSPTACTDATALARARDANERRNDG
jgi:murein DD-endopeptidase MepM/ murein hydrolase activator NlpD